MKNKLIKVTAWVTITKDTENGIGNNREKIGREFSIHGKKI